MLFFFFCDGEHVAPFLQNSTELRFFIIIIINLFFFYATLIRV
jgi:hypothetical protein